MDMAEVLLLSLEVMGRKVNVNWGKNREIDVPQARYFQQRQDFSCCDCGRDTFSHLGSPTVDSANRRSSTDSLLPDPA